LLPRSPSPLFPMTLIICPGVHSPNLTAQFLATLPRDIGEIWVVPTDYPPYSGWHTLQFMRQVLPSPPSGSPPLGMIAFSAGAVGGMMAAQQWEQWGGKVRGVMAWDGWGVPRLGRFPFYRVSHDHFTHWSSGLLGRGEESFYADPAVEHLNLWQSPGEVWGWWEKGWGMRRRCSLLELLGEILPRLAD
ncbi:hypothetical protein, partial [Spirulina subsalsa]